MKRLGPVGWPWVVLAGCIATGGLAMLHLGIGEAAVSPGVLIEALLQSGDRPEHAVIRQLRLPRTVAAILVGAAVALAGATLQSILRNPLASPTTLGVNAGAYFAIVLAAALGLLASPAVGLLITFTAGLVTGSLVFFVAGGWRSTPLHVVLAGVAVWMTLSAATAALQLLYEPETAGLLFWGAGSLIQSGWTTLRFIAPLLLLAVPAMLLLSRPLDVLALGDATALSLGQRTGWVRALALTLCVLLISSAVVVAGPIGFIGLVAPNLVRLIGLREHRRIFLASMLFGVLLLLAADIAAQLMLPGPGEMPVGAVTALVGGPFLAWLVRTARSGPQAGAGFGAAHTASPHRQRFHVTLVAALALLLICLAASLCLGQLSLSPVELMRAMAGRPSDPQTPLLLELRVPRVLLAGLAGAALAIAGVLVQGVVRNPLAAPETLGVTGGASLAALAALLLLPDLPVALIPFAAFLGGSAALLLTLLIAGPRASGHRIALAGIALAAAFGAGTSLLIVQADVRVAQALVWLAGSVYGRDWSTLLALGGWLAALLPLIVLSVRPLDVLAVGRPAARSLGVAWPATPRAILLLSAALAAAAVAAVGAVAFLGLVAPHLARLSTGPRHRRLVPLAALVGALLLMTADLLGRTVLSPRQIPAGIVTAIIGAPYFVYLLARSRRWQ